MEREAISLKLLSHFPHVHNYFRFYCFDAALLLMSDRNSLQVCEFFSCTGVKQEDPMGDFFFNLATISHIVRLVELVIEGLCKE